ncbi:DUF3782 domain-containing protein [Desulfonatronospira sp.]|uniref:PD-(D/E)XK nuclease family protein n=1 Tax=Desulfonatronospira sp. TaxID=1962951 RepID=UPI0025BD75D3|nr:DUF3782 domain-containing protein [Desulfonatronospira sp.]
METQKIKETIKRELPRLVQEDPVIRNLILELSRTEFVDKKQAQDWFQQTLAEMRNERERQDKRWEAWERRWDQNQAEQAQKWELWEKRWEKFQTEQAQKWELWEMRWEKFQTEQAQKWDEQHRKWEEMSRRLEENQKAIIALDKKLDRSIGALGARWGLKSENTFRMALAGVLEDSFGVKVMNITVVDHEGEVFGRPEQVELDIIIKNGLLIICELKSSMSNADMHIFERKARFYEKKHGQKADRLMVISPMIDPRAMQVANALNIETYSDSINVESIR